MRSIGGFIAAVVAAALMGSGLTVLVLHGRTTAASSQTAAVPASLTQNPDFERLLQVYGDIRTQTIWRNTPASLWTGAINGMIGTLHDQFSDYLSPAAMASLNQELGQSFGGIGVEMDVNAKGQFVVVAVFPHTPAARAGLKAGDIIVGVNGKNVTHETADQVASSIRGKVGTEVSVTVARGSRSLTFRVTRGEITAPTVFTKMLPGHIGYMNIAEFGYSTGGQVLAGYRQLIRQGARGILLDLRNNPGGDVAQCQIAAGALVPRGPLVTLKYKNPLQDETLNSPGPGTKLPVVVLVNGDTASAAEILSAAIQQRGVGILVGTKTFGKGIVQELEPLAHGAYLKLTVARYLTPNGDYIEHKGLTPNVVVPEPANVTPSDNPATDPQLERGYQILLARMAKG
ncbi:MAG: S41 family peptidase [Clostridia bacterium]